jgi:hypothetical protein
MFWAILDVQDTRPLLIKASSRARTFAKREIEFRSDPIQQKLRINPTSYTYYF